MKRVSKVLEKMTTKSYQSKDACSKTSFPYRVPTATSVNEGRSVTESKKEK
jgi:hypothetical protein